MADVADDRRQLITLNTLGVNQCTSRRLGVRQRRAVHRRQPMYLSNF